MYSNALRRQHDIFNIAALGILNALWGAAAMGHIATSVYFWFFLGYMIIDIVYLAAKPLCVGFCKGVLCHHFVVVPLLITVIRIDELSYHAMLMGCVEVDTWVMTVRRTCFRTSRLAKAVNLITFTVTRFVFHPYAWALVYTQPSLPPNVRCAILAGLSVVLLFSLFMAKAKIAAAEPHTLRNFLAG